MPELPEVEVLVRHLAPLLKNKTIRRVSVRRGKVIAPARPRRFAQALEGARFVSLSRRGKYLLFRLRAREGKLVTLLGHLGMTGRMYLAPATGLEPKHAAVVFSLGALKFIYEDTRYFGRLTWDTTPLARLGPEPLSPAFDAVYLRQALKRSAQPIKVKLLDQRMVAGIGNIYASEALFRAGISPRLAARRLTPRQVDRLWRAIPAVLREAIDWGSTVPLSWGNSSASDGVFYFGRPPATVNDREPGLKVYDREGTPCPVCRTPIRRIVQAARSTFFCPRCQ